MTTSVAPIPGSARLARDGDAGFSGQLCERWGDWSELTLVRLARQPLQPGQVRIAVIHAGVGFALQLIVAGKYQRKPPLPFTPGTEICGVVMETSAGEHRLHVGQRVVAAVDWGACAEEVIATSSTVYPLPDGILMDKAAALPLSYGTAWAALHWRGALKAGEVLLVYGAGGGVGGAAVQIGRMMGAQVIAVASTPEKRAAALANGAQWALEPDPPTLIPAVKEIGSGAGADVVLDTVGGDLFDAALRCVAPGGRVLSIGYASGRIPLIPANILLVKNVAVIGFNVGLYVGWGLTDERARYSNQVQTMMADMFDAITAGRLELPRTQHFGLHDWKRALGQVMLRRSVGKVILDVETNLQTDSNRVDGVES